MMYTLGAALGAAIGLGVLLGYAKVHNRILGINYSPRLMACWTLPFIDITVTIYLIAGNWFGLGSSNMGIMMTQFTVWTAIGLSLTVMVVRKLFLNRWREQYEIEKRTFRATKKRSFA